MLKVDENIFSAAIFCCFSKFFKFDYLLKQPYTYLSVYNIQRPNSRNSSSSFCRKKIAIPYNFLTDSPSFFDMMSNQQASLCMRRYLLDVSCLCTLYHAG